MEFLGAIWNTLAPHLVEMASVVVAGVIAWATAALRRKWGLEIEARHREALHAAVMSGVRAALARQSGGRIDTDAAVGDALAYVQQSVPDALGALRPSAHTLADLARAKLAEAVR